MAQLARTIEVEIIPRLLLALRSPLAGTSLEEAAYADVNTDEVGEFARLVANHDVSVASKYVNVLLMRGASLERIYLHLMAPAARLLGEWWSRDSVDFVTVTSGLCRMHQLLHEFSPAFLRGAPAEAPERTILLVPMPGEQHSLGLVLVAEFFRRSGWDVCELHPSTDEDVFRVLRERSFAMVGVSLACESRIDELAPLISRIRTVSKNRRILVMVGGHPFSVSPALIEQVGADGSASDGRRAVMEAAGLLRLLTRRI